MFPGTAADLLEAIAIRAVQSICSVCKPVLVPLTGVAADPTFQLCSSSLSGCSMVTSHQAYSYPVQLNAHLHGPHAEMN